MCCNSLMQAELSAAYAALNDLRVVRLINASMDDDVPEQAEAFSELHYLLADFDTGAAAPESISDGLACIALAVRCAGPYLEDHMAPDGLSAIDRVLRAARQEANPGW